MQLYDLAGEDPNLRFSPYCWRVRLALAHKGVEAETIPWRYHEKYKIAATGQGAVPVLVDGKSWVADSWDIAVYLEDKYPERPTLFAHGERTRALLIKHWVEKNLHPHLARIVTLDVFRLLHPDDQAYYRRTREERYGTTLEKFTADREGARRQLQTALEPLRLTLVRSPYLGGKSPDFSDFTVFGSLQWARCTSDFPLLESDDPIFYWSEQLLHAFDGLAFHSPHRETTPQPRRAP